MYNRSNISNILTRFKRSNSIDPIYTCTLLFLNGNQISLGYYNIKCYHFAQKLKGSGYQLSHGHN